MHPRVANRWHRVPTETRKTMVPTTMSGTITGPFVATVLHVSHVRVATFMKYLREHVSHIGPS